MESLWSMSTTVREAERILGFLRTAHLLNGENWDHATNIKFQILLIQHRQYLNDENNTQSFNKLSKKQIELLKDKSINMSYDQAKEIFEAKNYLDPAMRGRQSMAPLKKLGLAYIVDGRVHITDVGNKLIAGEILFGDFILDSLLKYQLSNHCDDGFSDWDTKPFVNTLRLIKEVNDLCILRNLKPKGISSDEFGIFVLSLRHYKRVCDVAKELLSFREKYDAITDDKERKKFKEDYIAEYLAEFNNPIKNVAEYTDNMVRYLRQTKYIFIRGKYNHTYIDLEPRRSIEINAILQHDNGASKKYTEEEWIKYMGTYGSYKLPFETVEKLTEIFKQTIYEINLLEAKLDLPKTIFEIKPETNLLKEGIEKAREYRTALQNKEIKFDYSLNVSKINGVIQILSDIQNHKMDNLANKPSVELEKWVNVALNIINDAINIKPNAPVGDDNEPTYTAPANIPDIECYYSSFNVICEVTMLKGRDQWFNEGQPVMRHLRAFESKNTSRPNYCLFIAPQIHTDTLETYWVAVKHGYKGSKQKILPITIPQLIQILKTVKQLKESGRNVKKENLLDLYNLCTNISSFEDSTLWPDFISKQLNKWQSGLFESK